jgi:hypothetical protein
MLTRRKTFGLLTIVVRCACICLTAILLAQPCRAADSVSTIDKDYEIVFFPTIAHSISNGKAWELEIRGCVYENDKHRIALGLLHEALALDHVYLTKAEIELLNQRTRLFMVDHKGGKRIVIEIPNHALATAKTKANGEFSATIRLSGTEVEKLNAASIEFRAVLPTADKRVFTEIASFAAPLGIIVISDIDDTIKITQVLDRRAAVKNTFIEPFKPVPGMPELYRAWATNLGAQFFYVSASPWQLFLPLSEFIRASAFPAGTFCLKEFRLKDNTRFSLFENPEMFKPGAIEPILKTFPERKFVFVGDSGERDPEIYGGLARRYQKQVRHIFIRDVTGDPVQSLRYQQAFRDLPATLWTIFHEPSEIASLKP